MDILTEEEWQAEMKKTKGLELIPGPEADFETTSEDGRDSMDGDGKKEGEIERERGESSRQQKGVKKKKKDYQ